MCYRYTLTGNTPKEKLYEALKDLDRISMGFEQKERVEAWVKCWGHFLVTDGLKLVEKL